MKRSFKKLKKGTKGITLIALVVTIIVILLLAGISISMLTGDNGILTQSQKAVVETDVSGTKEEIVVELVGMLDNEGNYTIQNVLDAAYEVTGNVVDEDEETVLSAKGNAVDISDLLTGASDNITKSWYYNGDGDITDGDVIVKIGDYVDYDPGTNGVYDYTSEQEKNGSSAQTYYSSDYTGTWRVMGIEDGKLVLISSASIGDLTLYGQLGYQYGEDELNNICGIYSHGEYAKSAESLDMDDMINLIGVDYTNYGSGYTFEYGNEVTYTMNASGYVEYSSKNGSGTLSVTSFTYYDETAETWRALEKEGDSVTLTSNALEFYRVNGLTGVNGSWYVCFDWRDEGSKNIYTLFGSDAARLYIWLSEKEIRAYKGCYFGLPVVWGYSDHLIVGSWGDNGTDVRAILATEDGSEYTGTNQIRACVTLKNNIELVTNGTSSWHINGYIGKEI